MQSDDFKSLGLQLLTELRSHYVFLEGVGELQLIRHWLAT
jgi:hypothetical protein